MWEPRFQVLRRDLIDQNVVVPTDLVSLLIHKLWNGFFRLRGCRSRTVGEQTQSIFEATADLRKRDFFPSYYENV
ncbi:hypothetical protein LEP1GSC005_0834 [Leptospira santarosai str. ST188]|nr:hypothetical protein LEP1GSC005_0834 [Leptospira santarosai str. ST188]